MSKSLGYELSESTTPDGGVVVELFVEGNLFARASASPTVLADMQCALGVDRGTVVADLREHLLNALKSHAQMVSIKGIVEDPKKRLRYEGRFSLQLGKEITPGHVWYDVTESTTGPASVPAVVRNKMRHEVHRRLTSPGSSARALVDLHP